MEKSDLIRQFDQLQEVYPARFNNAVDNFDPMFVSNSFKVAGSFNVMKWRGKKKKRSVKQTVR